MADLIIHKAFSGRPRDREDLEAIVAFKATTSLPHKESSAII